MQQVLVTGGSGFFGSILVKELIARGFKVINIDLVHSPFQHENFISFQADIRNRAFMEENIFKPAKLDAIFHCAAILAHAVKDKKFLWESNVNGTRNVVELAARYGVPKLVFTSSNCLWAENMRRPVREDDQPRPVEIYGKSKWEGEKVLQEYKNDVHSVIFRCPTIMDAGRLGLLGILFEFIDEGRKVWVVGGGDNRYQFIYAQDLVDACLRAVDYRQTEIMNIGSDDVKTFREVYDHVINRAGTGARVASLPRWLVIPAMQLAYALRMSPLGPYQYKMIAEDFVFDTARIKQRLNWRPTLKNEEMLWKAYEYYHNNLDQIKNRREGEVSAHNQSAKMGVIRLLKWLS
jgi:nucleoside-diphosphate-sugar epimerase